MPLLLLNFYQRKVQPSPKTYFPENYLSALTSLDIRRGIAQDIKIFGQNQPSIATEGWKDALRIHKETSETTVALPGVTKWELLPNTVHKIIYDADASINPYVWSPLIRAGHHKKGLLVAYFPSTVAGQKGGACEFFNQGGQWSEIEFTRSSHLLRHIHQQCFS